jgi:SulP family sulfate permease
VTFFSALFLELEFAIFAGVLLSLVLYLERTSKPRMVTWRRTRGCRSAPSPASRRCPSARSCASCASTARCSSAPCPCGAAISTACASAPEQKHLAVIADGINFVDLQGGEALAKEAERRRADGGGFYLINVKQGLWEALERCGCMEAEGARNVFQSKEAAIRGIFQKLDKSVCATATSASSWSARRCLDRLDGMC